MTRPRFWVRLVRRSLAGRWLQSALVVVSITVATSVVATLLCLSTDVQRKVTDQLAEFGANAVLVPAGDAPTFGSAEAQALMAGLAPGTTSSPLLYQRGEIGAVPVIIAGVDPATIAAVLKYRLAGAPLPTSGVLPSGWTPALAGARLARSAGLAPARPSRMVPVAIGGRRIEVEITGIITTGEAEEDQLFVPLPALEALSGAQGQRSAVLLRVPGRPEEVGRTVASLRDRAGVAGIDAKVLRRVAAAAGAALAKIRGLLAILSVVVLVASLLSAGTVLMEQAIERRREVGLLKSLGARDVEVVTLALGEAAGLGMAGGLLGAALGVGMADLLERVVFGSALVIPPQAPAMAVLLGLLLAIAAAALPLRASLAVYPAIALRED